MRYQELRDKIQNRPKYLGTEKIERAPLIHDGFPGTFNLSFTEHPWLMEYGGYVNPTHDWHFSTIQSCVRFNDFYELTDPNKNWKYLGVFEMADVVGILNFANAVDYSSLQREQVSNTLALFVELGISINRIHANYCAGGTVSDLTLGKYIFNFTVPEDKLSKESFLESGVPNKNLILDRTRNTFLSLNMYGQPSPWGYRNEVFINVGTLDAPVLLDCATIEYFPWAPIKDRPNDLNVLGIASANFGCSVGAVGLERLCMAANNLQRVQEVDYIKLPYSSLEDFHEKLDYLAVESLRALHRISSDISMFDLKQKVSKNRKDKIRKFARNIANSNIDLNKDKIRQFLNVHSSTQPWHPELYGGIEPTIEIIEQYRRNTK